MTNWERPLAVADKLSKLYPSDKATGFKLDDFRGVFWVKLKK